MSDKYILRSGAIDAIKRNAGTLYTREAEFLLQKVIFLLKNAPAADVVPVVRCKNCKWFADNNGGEWYGCKMFHVVRITPEDAPKPDDFCSYGERRGGGDDNVSD
jgi:hypothetical protein